MDDDNHPKPNSKTTFFLGCFGFSRKRRVSRKKPPKFVQSHHKYNWFSRSRTFLLEQSATKTVPVEYSAAISEKLLTTLKKSSKLKKKSSSDEIPSKRKNPASQDKIPATEPKADATSDQAPEHSPNKTNDNSEHNIILQSGKPSDSPKQLSSRRKTESSRNCSCSRPGSPNPGAQGTVPAIDRVTSFPATNPRVNAKKNGKLKKDMEPLIGMSILMITLMIMLLWGRLCAIVCTSAWLYFVRRLSKQTPNGTVKNGSVSDFNQEEEEKKRVVLEGFLDRNHRWSPPS